MRVAGLVEIHYAKGLVFITCEGGVAGGGGGGGVARFLRKLWSFLN